MGYCVLLQSPRPTLEHPMQELGWQLTDDKRTKQRHVWCQLQQDLARTLNGLYTMCEAEWHTELIEETVQYLEQSVNDFKQAAHCLQLTERPMDTFLCQLSQQQKQLSQQQQQLTQQQQQLPQGHRQHDQQQLLQQQQDRVYSGPCGFTGSGEGPPFGSSAEALQAPAGCEHCSEDCCLAPEGAASHTTATRHCSTSHSSMVAMRCCAHPCPDTCSHDASLADDAFSSCSSSNSSSAMSTSSCFSDCGASKNSIASSSCSGTAWQGQVEWTELLNRPDAAELQHKLSSPNRLRKSPHQTKTAADERHAKAERLRTALAEEKLARIKHQQSAKQQKRNKDCALAVAARTADKHQRSKVLRAAHISRIKAKALDETRKVEEVTFINTLNNEGRKAELQQRLEEGEARRAEALAAILAKQQGAAACVKEAAERRKQAEAERLAQLAERQRKKQEAVAKIKQERQAAAAARDAAKAAAQAVTQQREAARQQRAALLSSRIYERLREAAQRRLKHLDMIKERAALGKETERRDVAGGVSTDSRSPSPGSLLFKQQLQQHHGCSENAIAIQSVIAKQSPVEKNGHGTATYSTLNAAAPEFCPASRLAQSSSSSSCHPQGHASCPLDAEEQLCLPSHQSSCSETSSNRGSKDSRCGSRGSSPLPPNAAAAYAPPAVVLQELKGNSQSIDQAGFLPAGSHKNSIKGARRRMAKCRRKLLGPGTGCFVEPEHTQQLSSSPEAERLLPVWAPHLAFLNVQQPQLRSMQQPSEQTAAAQASPGQRQLCTASGTCGCSLSGKSHPGRSSSDGSLKQQHISCCQWSRSPQACTPRVAASERQDALASLVHSAHANLAKQPLLVCHLARQTGLLHLLCKEVLSATSGAAKKEAEATVGSGAISMQLPDTEVQSRARQAKLQQARVSELLVRLLELPLNLDYLLGSGPLLPGFAKAMLAALDHCNSLEADEPAMMTGGEAAAHLSVLLQVLVAVLEHAASSAEHVEMQEELVGFMVAAGTVGRLANVFSLFDQPIKDAAAPVPPHVLQCLRLLRGLTAIRHPADDLLMGKRWPHISVNAAALVMELQATSMAGVLSLLTAVLLNASPTCTPAEASSKALPPNFVEAASLVMSVLNNICRLDLLAAQHMLGCSHNRLEFFHLISFLLSYCSSRWPAAAPTCSVTRSASCAGQQQGWLEAPLSKAAAAGALDSHTLSNEAAPCSQGAVECSSIQQHAACEMPRLSTAVPAIMHHPVAKLLNQLLLLIGYFCVQHAGNQAILHWGRSPTILQRLCSVPDQYFRVTQLKAVLMPTLLSVCYKADRLCELVSQHTDIEMLLQYVQKEQQQQQHSALHEGLHQQQVLAQQTPAEVQAVQQPQSPAARSASLGINGGRWSSATLGSSSPAQYQLAKRFPLPALPDAEAFMQRQWHEQQAKASGGSRTKCCKAEVAATMCSCH